MKTFVSFVFLYIHLPFGSSIRMQVSKVPNCHDMPRGNNKGGAGFDRLNILQEVGHWDIPPTAFDIYQFGVPTQMDELAATVSNYSTYWGFDSFKGMPSQSDSEFQNPIWTEGALSLADEYGANTPEEAVTEMHKFLQLEKTRTRLVPGFFNESLTNELAEEAKPAWYVDINADRYDSTMQALTWLFANKIIQPGTLIMYDDWQNTPFGMGESGAHMDIAKQFKVSFSLKWARNDCKAAVLFQVDSIGKVSNAGITETVSNYEQWN